ncbi:hypothetical protein JTB14_019480 [Gonioctena quinquepunctata]|nr:hypothetical protein JTB14_019480 [Gonioctena quinquepunctata]
MHHLRGKMHDSNSKSNKNLFGQSVFSIIKLFVQQVVTKKETPGGTSGKYFMGLLFSLSLFLSSTYSSGLASIMTIPRYDSPINTVEEFAGNGIFWGGTQDAWIKSIQKAEDPIYKAIVSRFVAMNEEKLRDFSKTPNFAFSIERLPNQNYAIGSYIQKDVIGNYHLMEEDFYWEECVMMARKSSILLPLLDMFILRVFETGLISYWQNEDIESDLGDYTDSDVENTDSGVENIQDCVSIRIPANIPEESQEIEHSHLNDVNNLDPGSSNDDACSVDSAEVPLMNLIPDVSEKCIWRKKFPAAQTQEESGPTISNNSEAPVDIFLELFSTKLIERIAFETNLYATQSGKQYVDTSLDELKVFLGINLLRGIEVLPSYKD